MADATPIPVAEFAPSRDTAAHGLARAILSQPTIDATTLAAFLDAVQEQFDLVSRYDVPGQAERLAAVVRAGLTPAERLRPILDKMRSLGYGKVVDAYAESVTVPVSAYRPARAFGVAEPVR